MMKILKSLSLVVAVAAVAGGATYAIWSDTGKVAGASVSSGSLDLKIDSTKESGTQNFVDNFTIPTQYLTPFSEMYPGFEKEQVFDIKNEGTVGGVPTVRFDMTSQSEVSLKSAESAVGDTWDNGELQGVMTIAVYYKQSGEANFPATPAQKYTLSEYDANPNQLPLGESVVLPANGVGNVKVVVNVPADAGNNIMTDSATFDIIFGLSK